MKQKELGLGSMQLLHQYVPVAAGLLGILVPIFEPMGWTDPNPQTILGYRFTLGSVVAIAVSALLGLLVNLSTFLVSFTRGHVLFHFLLFRCEHSIGAWLSEGL